MLRPNASARSRMSRPVGCSLAFQEYTLASRSPEVFSLASMKLCRDWRCRPKVAMMPYVTVARAELRRNHGACVQNWTKRAKKWKRMKEYEHDAWIRGRALLPRLCRTWFRTTWGDMLCWTCNLQLGLILRATGGQAAAQEMTLESRLWRLSFRMMPNLLVVLDCFTISRAPSLIINHVRPPDYAPDYDTLTTYYA